MRDPWGIRPAYYYKDDEVVVVASEASVIQTAFQGMNMEISEIRPGYALLIKKDGTVTEELVREPRQRASCSFERIYFSRGNDRNIYRERKKLGELLTPRLVKAVDGDLDNTVFSFIPNTAETSFYGMVKGIQQYMVEEKKRLIREGKATWSEETLDEIICREPRIEKIVIKDAKLRTFITSDSGRDGLVGHVYDVTYGAVQPTDNLVVIDDSIVRGIHIEKEYSAYSRSSWPETYRGGVFRPADSLPRLLRDRHDPDERVYSVQCGHRVVEGTRHGGID